MFNASYHRSPLQMFASIWLLVWSMAFLIHAVGNPLTEWDMLAYAASTEAISSTDPYLIHDAAYGELQNRISEEEFADITGRNHYRTVMYQDPLAFYEQLPYYSIRIGFNTLLATISDLGVSVYDAGHWVSAFAFVFGFLVLWGSLNDRIHPVLQLVFPLMFYKYTQDLEVTRQILADSMSSVWVVFICIAYLRDSRLLLPLMALSVLVRVDLVIFSSLLLLLLFITEGRQRYLSLSIGAVALVVCYVLVQKWAGSYGWSTLYYFAIISDMIETHPSVYGEINFTFKEYLYSLFMVDHYVSKVFGMTLVFSAVTLFVWRKMELSDVNNRVCRICGVCMLYIVAHYLVFPQMYLRFFVSQNLMIYAGFAILCTHYWYVYAASRSGVTAANDYLAGDDTHTDQ